MGKPKIRPPSQVDPLTFPVFGLTWYGAPSSLKNDGCSVIAYCGGGGSAKTGVGNKIIVTVTADNNNSGGGNSSQPEADDNGGGVGDVGPTFTTRQIEISTGEALCFGVHAFRPYNDPLNMVRLLACVGDEILLYGIPLVSSGGDESTSNNDNNNNNNSAEGGGDSDNNNNRKEEAILLAKTNVGKGYGAGVATYSPLYKQSTVTLNRPAFEPPTELHYVAVGCENGIIVTYQLNQISNATTATGGHPQFEFSKVAECQGHTKSICAVNFHPRGTQLLSSAKDGTARIFSTETGTELGVLKCEIHDPKGPPPPAPPDPSTMKTKDPRMMKRAPQILVRGCAYGDMEGKIIYTVASGKRGPAYLTRWRTLVPLNQATAGPPGAPPSAASPTTTALSFEQQFRSQCSPVPVSATTLSADGTLLTLGSVEGSISLYDLEKRRVVKQFAEVHDLPVTCVASRPVPNVLLMPGELEGGVNFDAVSASADNRFGRWTVQKKSRIKIQKPPRSSAVRKKSVLEVYLWQLVRVPLYLMMLLAIVAVRDTMDICKEEFGLSALVMDVGASAGHCLYREVLWAEEGRVSFVPE